MPLHPGTTLGPYSVTAKIGEGGMGEVYRARDTKLERDVALKVLPQAFTDDPDRLARFEREAKVLASLNHPNIGHIYGLEEAEGQKALVLELVEGPTLAERIKQGPIPVDEALPIAKQIAEALEAAHEQGIIHRDLKPANIKVKDDGTVKVLDFGLAKAFQPDASDPNMSQSPTISLTAAATQMGMVIGTAAYMAPEQAKGLPVDKRVDIWAYGAVLFEMLTGRKLFEADDVSEMLASVLVKDPDVSRIGDHVPTHIRSVVRQCLVKDPKERLRDIGDVRLAMAGVFETGAAPAGSTVAASVVQPIWRTLLAPVGAAVGTALLVSLAAWGVMRTEPHQPVRFDHVLPDGLNFGNTGQPMIDVSPDGHTLVYNTTEGLYLRELDELSARLIPGTSANVTNPFFSPDGQTVGYWERSTDELKRVNIAGGAPVTITGAQNPLGVTWERNGTILYGQRDGVWRVAETGGTPELVVPIEEAERVHGPRMLPNDDWVLFTLRPSGASWDQSQVVAQSLTTGERVTLIDVGRDGRYVESDHLVYGLNGVILAVPFDPATRSVLGGPVSLIDGVGQPQANTGAMHFALSSTGTAVYAPGLGESGRLLLWVDRSGLEEFLPFSAASYLSVALSPDGLRAAVGVTGVENPDVYVADLDRGTLTRVTTDASDDRLPIWSPDGQSLVFTSDRQGRAGLFLKMADGTGTAQELLLLDESIADVGAVDWTPTGDAIVVEVGYGSLLNNRDIGLVSVGDDSSWMPLIASEAAEISPAISPDGHWLAYSSNETGRFEIYVQRFPELGGRQTISTSGGHSPLWSSDGRELYYLRTVDGPPVAMMAVSIEGADSELRAGQPEELFDWEYFSMYGPNRRFAQSPADGRFLLLGSEASASPGGFGGSPMLTVVLDWFEELKERVPLP